MRTEELSDDGRLPDLVSGLMWVASAGIGLVALALPGSSHEHVGAAVALAAGAFAWGAFSLVLAVRGFVMSLPVRAGVTAGALPVVALALWATGGATSFIGPLLLFSVLFVGYFFPARYAWPLAALLVATWASPLLYDDAAHRSSFPARALTFAAAVIGMTLCTQALKKRLVAAEARQRTLAGRDPLTGLANRRSFDAALSGADLAGRGAALILFDLDSFKAVNDAHGHPVGDAVLRAVARAARTVVREADCLARIGGDEFAVVAPGAGEIAARRIVSDLAGRLASAPMPAGVEAARVTFGYAVAPAEGADAASLFKRADERLLARKRAERRVAEFAGSSMSASNQL
jgi:diguanylate cyclase (GGDEF)-like protein